MESTTFTLVPSQAVRPHQLVSPATVSTDSARMESTAAVAMIEPSTAGSANRTNESDSGHVNTTVNRKNTRSNQNKSRKKQTSVDKTTESDSNEMAAAAHNVELAANSIDSTQQQPTEKKKRRNRKKKNKPTEGKNEESETSPVTLAAGDQKQPPRDNVKSTQTKNNSNKQNNARNKQRKHSPYRVWHKHIPKGTVDPITLDSLFSLAYPPFALAATEPYDVVESWPPVDNGGSNNRGISPYGSQFTKNNVTKEERQRQVLQEQWGKAYVDHSVIDDKATADSTQVEKQPPSTQPKHFNLYDGRALAYYMVSQLQFIDPLNRRDLTRDELVNLDRYLRRHGFTDLNVTEAYDAKGITISTAGAAGHTAAGRAAMLQQEARALLNTLFGGSSVTAVRSNNVSSAETSLQTLHQAHQEAEQFGRGRFDRNANTGARRPRQELVGVYGEEGMIVIDDDANPGLRGSAPEFIPDVGWPGHNVTNALRSPQAQEFPSLAETVPAEISARQSLDTQHEQERPTKPITTSKTLSVIAGAVKKTDPDELQRQREALKEARRRALMSNLTFGLIPVAWDSIGQGSTMAQEGPPTTITTVSAPSEAQLERNKAFAEALGIKPATMRISSGWARPTNHNSELDEFGKELNLIKYPDVLILQARGKMGPLIKLEKKWLTFLADNSAASLPLNPMDRAMRTFVHEYSDFWKLHTESFDHEPKRYIHCVKLQDTRAPYPLLSDVAASSRGPQPQPSLFASSVACDHSLQQTAGQNTRGRREIPAAPERLPLPLKARSVESTATTLPISGVSISGAPTRTMTEAAGSSSRFDALATKERQKLTLQKRTLPLELPPYDPRQQQLNIDLAEELQRRRVKIREKALREQEKIARQQQALQEVFASDDEDDDMNHGKHDDDNLWEKQEPLFSANSEEEEEAQ